MIRTILAGLLLLFLQIFKSSELAIGGITPNLLIPYAIFIGWAIEDKWAYFLIFITALGYDIVMPQTLGLNSLVLVIICSITRMFHRSVLEPKLPVVFLLSLITSSVYYFTFGIYYMLEEPEFWNLFLHFIFSTIYSSILSLLLFYLLMLSYKLEIRFR